MPPKPRFSREEIAAAALAIVKEKGAAALTAREIGKYLGSSPTPIFTVFQTMEEVKWEARKLALKEFQAYAADFADDSPAFKRIGLPMIRYATREPELYKLLFMQEHPQHQNFTGIPADLRELAETAIAVIMQENEMTQREACLLFEHLWIYTFGIGVLCANRVCNFTEEQIAEKLAQIFAAV